MKTTIRFLLIIFVCLFSSVFPVTALEQETGPSQAGLREYEEWMGTYFKGKKLGFSHSRVRYTPDEVEVHTKVYFRLRAENIDQSTTFTQDTRLTPDLKLKRFSLLQELMGSRQNIEGFVRGDQLHIHVTSPGFNKEKEIPYSVETLPSSTYLLNIIRKGLAVGMKGEVPLFVEAFQLESPLKYEVLRKEMIDFRGKQVEAFVMKQDMTGLESTLWITREGFIVRELTNMGFESINEPRDMATRLDEDVVSISGLITLSMVKPERPIPNPGSVRELKLRLSRLRDPNLLPVDHRQQVLDTESPGDGTYSSILFIQSEPPEVMRPAAFPVKEKVPAVYLEDTPEVQSRHPLIKSLARNLVDGAPDAWKAAVRINRWVYANIEKDLVDNASALDALRTRRGECQSHTYLFAAVARAAGIPTKIVNGLVYSPVLEGFLYHAWPEVYVGEWRALDPTLGQIQVDATHIKLSESEKSNSLILMEYVGKVQIKVVEN